VMVDHLPPFGVPSPVGVRACPSVSLCVAVGYSRVLTSTNPSDGAAAWTVRAIDGPFAIHGLACPSTTLCVGVDSYGQVLTTADAAAGNWSTSSIDPGNQLYGLACPSTALCVAGDGAGNLFVST